MDCLLYKTQTRWLFHSHIKIKLPAFYEETIFDELFNILEYNDKKYNSYSRSSFFSKINDRAGEFTETDEQTIEIIKKTSLISSLFEGKYDITIMPLIKLWGFYKEKCSSIPTQEQILDVKKKIDYKKIEIRGKQVKIGKDQELITGSFIKAYAVDRMIKELIENGINDVIVNAGGSTIKALRGNEHPYWEAVVRKPDNKEKLFNVKLSDKCLSTSGQAETYVEFEGKKYGHILNPSTGYPSPNKQVGIISDDCFTGDMLSTAMFNLQGEEFLQKARELKEMSDIEAYLIDDKDRLYMTNGFHKYLLYN